MSTKIHSSIACNLDADMLQASLPLFRSEKVQAIEWSFDTLFNVRQTPPWFSELLHAFGSEGRLIGHGVFFSLFSGKWSIEQQQWLDRLQELSNEYQFDHVTEHFGFMTGRDFHHGAPIGIPYTESTLAIGRDRLNRIQQACQRPIGLENLAFSYCLDEVKRHGEFLHRLLEPLNGFLILDLHNLYCQLHNFKIKFEELIQLYELDRVREIHISGGSWEASAIDPDRQIRRDTHDDGVPAEVFSLLERTIGRCPNLKFVVLEQLGVGLKTEASRLQFQSDFGELDRIVEAANDARPTAKEMEADFLPKHKFNLSAPVEDESIHAQQLVLSDILEAATDHKHASQLMTDSVLANSAWQVETWSPDMIETAVRIAQKWKQKLD